jgi:hypothetical protein
MAQRTRGTQVEEGGVAARHAAVCLLGSVRTLMLDCVGPTTLRRIVQPLRADLFAFVNVPENWSMHRVRDVAESIRAMARDAAVREPSVQVDNQSPNSVRQGVAQARGLRRCWEATTRKAGDGGYGWVVRVRTDVYHGFALPPLRALPVPSEDAVYAGFVGGTHCGAPWVDDRVALLHGARAQALYLQRFADALEASASAAPKAPECLLGAVLHDGYNDSLRVRVHDIRSMVTKQPPCTHASALIVRKDCAREAAAQPWVCPPGHAPPVLSFW